MPEVQGRSQMLQSIRRLRRKVVGLASHPEAPSYERNNMKTILVLLLLTAGCASPAADYIRADKAAWDVYDHAYDASGHPALVGPTLIDRWIDQEPTFSLDLKDAMHQLNVARRARVNHAIAAVGS